MIDMKDKIEELVKKITSDKNLQKNFLKDPISVVEELIGIDLPNNQIEKLADSVKAKLAVDNMVDALDSLGGLFGKK